MKLLIQNENLFKMLIIRQETNQGQTILKKTTSKYVYSYFYYINQVRLTHTSSQNHLW